MEREEVLTDPQIEHNGIIVQWDHPHIGRLRQAGPAADFQGTPTTMLHQIDDLGGSTVEILRALGRSADEISELAAAGTIFVGE